MTRWKIVRARPVDYRAMKRDTDGAWAIDAQSREMGKEQIVQVFQAHPKRGGFPPECEKAISTHGKSALRPYLDDQRLPAVIFLTTDGVRVEPAVE